MALCGDDFVLGRRRDHLDKLSSRRPSEECEVPIPKAIARFNRLGLNRVTRRIAPWMPGFGVVVHRGRRSGRVYRTPVNVFPKPHGYVIALTDGPDTDG